MISLLYIIGVIVFFISIITGFNSGSYFGIIIGIAAGIQGAIVFFALAKILDNQNAIISKLERQETLVIKHGTRDEITCSNCERKYESDFTRCPYCGYKQN